MQPFKNVQLLLIHGNISSEGHACGDMHMVVQVFPRRKLNPGAAKQAHLLAMAAAQRAAWLEGVSEQPGL